MSADSNGMFPLGGVSEYYGSGWITVRFISKEMKELDVHLLVTDPPKQVVNRVQGAHLTVIRGERQANPREDDRVNSGIAELAHGRPPDRARRLPIACQPIQFDRRKRGNFARQLSVSGAAHGSLSANTTATE